MSWANSEVEKEIASDALAPGSRWTQEEDDFLLTHYANITAEEARSHLPHRTVKAIQVRASILDVRGKKAKCDKWSQEELETLLRVYPEQGINGCKPLLPHRTRPAIREMARLRNLRCKHGELSTSWIDEELEIVEMYYPDNGSDICCAFLPHRSIHSVRHMARELKLKRKNETWSKDLLPQDWTFVMSRVAELGFIKCAEPLGETPENLRDRCLAAGIDCDSIDLAFMGRDEFKVGSYSAEEKEYVKRHFFSQGSLRVAYTLGRSPSTMAKYAKMKLRLAKPGLRSRPPFTVLNATFNTPWSPGYINVHPPGDQR